ncbi:MAG: DUF2188 domain-containing protein [Brevundimonas sp.]|uniref:DUF2188 domain-containing protein n=1 Tax=Brevundimonas sp. TaxID=1871086 RepID=UPI002735E628|nr:DUF2188 domain-containing protein [Brevundimonas sp.]MDP3405205.1 DUF2188 domain-containing protein [Brevundimonas sp.]
MTSHRVAVKRNGSGWVVSDLAGGPTGSFQTKTAAVTAAKRSLAKLGGTLTVHQSNGQVRQTVTLGRDTAVRLNGIEGVAMNTATRRILRDVQASGLTPAQQLKALSAAFRK